MFPKLLGELASAEYPSLRPMQHEVVESYAKLLGADGSEIIQSDVAIEMPAGTGKTLVALLIAEHHRRLGRPVAILTGTRQLGRQVAEDASALGVEVTHFEGPGRLWSRRDLRRYRIGESVALMNYWAYFNINPTPPPAEVLILDDAHLAENAIGELFTVRVIQRDRPDLYKRILAAFTTLRPGRYLGLEDIIHDRFPPRDPLLVPFTDWIEAAETIKDLLDAALSDGISDSIQFIWPRIRQKTDALAVYITTREVELRPIVYPTREIDHFARPKHRLYLSATLGQPDDFQRRLGCSSVHVIRPSDPQPGERGRRMIVLFPSAEEGPQLEQIQTKGLNCLWPVARKRLWMCSSWEEAELWKGRVPPLRDKGSPPIWELRGSEEAPLDEFRQARLGHLFTAARYDGMDFPGDQARLALIPSPPITLDAQEEFFSAFLRDASFMKSRFSQRIAQALGRCNRSSADFAVYVLLHPRFERVFGGSDTDYLALLPRDIRPEMEAGIENAEDGFVTSCEKAARFLSGQFEEWDSHVTSIGKASSSQGSLPTSLPAQYEVNGCLALWRGDPVRAAEQFRLWESSLSGERQSGVSGFARYCHAWARYVCYKRHNETVALQDAIDSLEGAARAGPSSWFTTTLRSVLNDLRRISTARALPSEPRVPVYKDALLQAWDDILYERGLSVPSFNRWIDRCVQNLNSQHHDEVAESLDTLGFILGFESYRPRGQGMPDVIWRFSRGPMYVVTWEVKAELADERLVAQRDVDQAHGQGRWAESSYGSSGYTCMPLLVSKATDFEPGVSERLGSVRCVTQASLLHLGEAVRRLFEVFRSQWRITDSEARLQARQTVSNRIPDATWLHSAYKSSKDFISENRLISGWSKST